MNIQNEKQGKLVIIEGIDGAGTTTQTGLLVAWLKERGYRAAQTCEPSQGPAGALLRQILSGRSVVRAQDGTTRALHNDAIALLFAADRMDHLDSEILPMLQDGVQIISDRYYHSSYTYQSLLGDFAWLQAINKRARKPDVTYFLDVSAEAAATRRQHTRSGDELYEVLETQQKLVHAYRKISTLLKNEAIVTVDGTRNVEVVHQAICEDLNRRFGWR